MNTKSNRSALTQICLALIFFGFLTGCSESGDSGESEKASAREPWSEGNIACWDPHLGKSGAWASGEMRWYDSTVDKFPHVVTEKVRKGEVEPYKGQKGEWLFKYPLSVCMRPSEGWGSHDTDLSINDRLWKCECVDKEDKESANEQ